MRILLTGGAGYVGSHALVDLLAAGHDVHVLDSLAGGHAAALDRVRVLAGRGFGFSRADIRDRPALERIIAEVAPEAVLHFAGLKSPSESLLRPAAYRDVNVAGSRALIEALGRSSCRRLVFSSTAAIYGPPERLPVDEDHPLRPATPYGATKLAVERLMRAAAATDPAWSVVILRYFNPVGAHASARIGEHPAGTPTNLMPQLVAVAAGRRPALEVFGDDYDTPDGTGVRDYLHVADLARAHLAALDRTGQARGAEVFNLGTGTGVSVREMVRAFAEVSGRAVPLRMAPRRVGDVAACWADPSQAARELGWRAEHDLRAMCASAWAWEVGNPAGYGSAQTCHSPAKAGSGLSRSAEESGNGRTG